MKELNHTLVAHVAIGSNSLAESRSFYEQFPGSKHTRSYDDRECFNFWGIQLTIHLSPKDTPKKYTHYPYHYGVNLTNMESFNSVKKFVIDSQLSAKTGLRFKGTRAEHYYVSFPDPSNNCIEFKYYTKSEYGY